MSPVKECALISTTWLYQPVRARDEAFVEEMRGLKTGCYGGYRFFGQILPKRSSNT